MRSSFLRLAMVLGVGVGLVGCQSSGSGGFSMWPWKKKDAETLVEDTTTPKLPSKLAQPQVINQQGYGQYAATGSQSPTGPTTSMGTQAGAPAYTATAPQYGQNTPGTYTGGGNVASGATPAGYSPTPPPSSGYSSTPNYASTGYPSMIQGGGTAPAGSAYTGQAGGNLNSPPPLGGAAGYSATPSSPAYGSPGTVPSAPGLSPGSGSGSLAPAPSASTPPLGGAGYPPSLGTQGSAAPSTNPLGHSSYQPGQTGYQPGQSSYQPGQTGYNPPATVTPGSLPGMTPATTTPGAAGSTPARGSTPYRPGSTSDYIPGTLPGAAGAAAATPAAPTSTPGTIPSGVPATPGYVPPSSSVLPGQSISGTSGVPMPTSTGGDHSGHSH